jgi:hypothetical protein
MLLQEIFLKWQARNPTTPAMPRKCREKARLQGLLRGFSPGLASVSIGLSDDKKAVRDGGLRSFCRLFLGDGHSDQTARERELIEFQDRDQMRRLRAFFKTRMAQLKSWFGASK